MELSYLTPKFRKHVTAVLAVIAYEQLTVLLYEGKFVPLVAALDYAVDIPFFYLASIFLLPLILEKPKDFGRSVLLPVIAVSIYLLLFYYIYVFAYWYKHTNMPEGMTLRIFKRGLSRCIHITAMALAYYYARVGIRQAGEAQQEKVLILEERNRHVLIENDLLRAQISPHLLFNSLSFIHALVARISEKAAEAIMLLSRVMRYSIRATGESGKIPLRDELLHIKDYIRLVLMPGEGTRHLNLEITALPENEDLEILPAILSGPVENVFKHGDLSDAANPASIRIDLSGNVLTLITQNLSHEPQHESIGVGTRNMIGRLERQYHGKYTLQVDEQQGWYNLLLRIEL